MQSLRYDCLLIQTNRKLRCWILIFVKALWLNYGSNNLTGKTTKIFKTAHECESALKWHRTELWFNSYVTSYQSVRVMKRRLERLSLTKQQCTNNNKLQITTDLNRLKNISIFL